MLFLGIDLGTSGTKALLIDGRGAVCAAVTVEHPIATPRPGWSEQDPEDWWRSTIGAVRTALERSGRHPSAIAAIGLSGQMHGLVSLDGSGRVLRPCILWNDQRSAAICEQVEREIGLETLLASTGNRMLPGFMAPKILWCREHEPEVFARAAMHLLPKDWLRYRLSGTFATEVSDASGTLLFDCGRRCWAEDLIAALAIDPRTLPPCCESPEVCARLDRAAAEALGLPDGIPIVGGAGDQAAQAIGSGIVDEGAVSVTIGTSGVVFAASRSWRRSGKGELHAFCHAVPGRWHVMGVMLAAGGSLRWYRDTFASELDRVARAEGRDAYDLLVAEAAEAPAGSRGISFLPYLSGERCPHPDPKARGALVGLSAAHRRADVTRAVLEGITFGLCDNLDLVRGLGIPAERVFLSGGGARSAFWRQLCADVFGVPVHAGSGDEGAALGAALLAGVGAGAWADVPAAITARNTSSGAPDSAAQPLLPRPDAALTAALGRYRSLYPLLRSHFAESASR